MNDLLKIAADVLDRAANYIDAVETAKVEAEKTAKVKLAAEIKDSLSALTGEEISAETAEKLASSDDVLKLFTKIAGSRVPAEKLGDAGEISDGSTLTPRSAKEAADAADKNFAAWLQS
jgi:hypothetical protein